MTRRFNNLNAALKFLRPTSAAEGSEVPDAPAGTPLKKFQDYKAGKVDLDYPRASGSLPGEFDIIALKPFALAAADTKAFRTSISHRAAGAYGTFGLSTTELGIDTTLNDTDIEANGYTPAKAVCRNTTGTTSTTKTSKVTGLPYKTKTNVSYTFPVGRITANPVWGEQKAAIIALVAASAGNKSVTFHPEKF